MTFDEFREFDVLGAYAEFKSVDYAKTTGEIPSYLHDHIKSKCQCGSDRMTNGTTLTCCNPRCYIKLGHRLSNMFTKFGAKNLGPSTCIKIVKYGIDSGHFILPSHMEIFNCFERFENVLGAKFIDLIYGLEAVHNSRMNFAQMVEAVNIPGFGSLCQDYFRGIENCTQLQDEIKRVGVVKFMLDRGVEDLKKDLNLVLFLSDVYVLERTFRGEKISKILKDVKICITGPVSPEGVYMKRDDFIRYVNKLSKVGDIQVFNISESGPATSSYVIADSPSSNRKYLKAKEREAYNPSQRVLYTSTEFVNLIRNEVEKCK